MDVSPRKSEEGKWQSECDPVSSGQTVRPHQGRNPNLSGFWAAAPSEGSGRGEASGSLPEGPRKAPAGLPWTCHGHGAVGLESSESPGPFAPSDNDDTSPYTLRRLGGDGLCSQTPHVSGMR